MPDFVYVGFGFKVVLPALKHLLVFYTIMCLCYGFVKRKKSKAVVILLSKSPILFANLSIYTFISFLLPSMGFFLFSFQIM